jgi:hypothetical protein
MFEDRAGLIVERVVAILTQTSLKHPIAALPNHGFTTTVWAIDAVTPPNLFEQVRGGTLRDERFDGKHCLLHDVVASRLPAVTSS